MAKCGQCENDSYERQRGRTHEDDIGSIRVEIVNVTRANRTYHSSDGAARR
jgi:hypothetical protein